MEKDIGRFHRFRYLGDGVSVVYEPAPAVFHWMSMYVPPEHRGQRVSRLVFDKIACTLEGTHWIHCSMTVKAFKALAVDYPWKRLGRSRYFSSCSCFLFEYDGRPRYPDGELKMRHEVLHRCRVIRTIKPKALGGIVRSIARDFANVGMPG